MRKYESTIKRDVCDCCGRRGPTAVTDQDGTSIFGICAGCDPNAFETVARRDIEAWLAGRAAEVSL
jgi:hypothetical protein